MSLLLRNGTVTNADEQFIGDVLIVDGKIAQVGQNLVCPKDVEEIDCTGKYVIPGGIDPHTHIEMQGTVYRVTDDWFSGSRAAAAGGTTCVIDFVPVAKGEHPKECLTNWERVAQQSVIDYSFHMSVVDWNDEVKESLEMAVEHGINSAKCYLAYRGALMLDSNQHFIEFFDFCAKHGILPQVHCEDGDVVPFLQNKLFEAGETTPSAHPKSRPSWVEASAVNHAATMAAAADCPVYIVHNTCSEALDVIERFDNCKHPVIAECTVSHLVLTDEMNDHPDFNVAAGAVLSPPLRKEKDRQALWSGIRRGLVKTICTDHCPWTLDQKRAGLEDFRKIPNGVPALEERMTMTWSSGVATGLISPMEFVAATSTNAAKIFGMYPRKGAIRVGSDGDVVVIDPKAKRIMTKADQKGAADYNLFEGLTATGIPVLTVSNGRVLWRCEVKDNIAMYKDGILTEEKNGQFIPRKAFVPDVFGRI